MQNVAQFASIVFFIRIYTMADVVGFEYNITSHHNQDNYLADPEACHVQ